MQGPKNGQEFDLPQPPPIFFSGKKLDPENPGKIRMLDFGFLGSGFEKGQQKIRFYGVIS